MTPALWQRLDQLARHLVPVALTLALLLVSIVPLRLPVLKPVLPSLALIAVYYWTLYRPDLLPAFAAFAIGLSEDVLTGAPLGVNAFVFVAAHGVVASQRKFLAGKSFAVVWLGFALTAGGGFLLAWLFVSAFYGVLIDGAAVTLQAIATVGCLPLMWRLLVRCQLSVLKQV